MNSLFELGREAFLDGTADWDTHTFTAFLMDLHTPDTGVKAITDASNATPIVVTAAAHGFTNGDLVSIGGVLGNLAANGYWKIANVATNTFELTHPVSGSNAVGSAAYTSGGYVVNQGPSAVGDNYDDFNGTLVGTGVNLTSPTKSSGVADADNVTFSAVTGATVEAVGIYKNTGTPSTSRMIALIDGRQMVTIAAVTVMGAGSTTFPVERLAGAIPSGTILTFSNGKTITLDAAPSAGARTISGTGVNLDSFAAGVSADAPTTASGLPVTPNGGDLTVTFSSGADKIFKL